MLGFTLDITSIVIFCQQKDGQGWRRSSVLGICCMVYEERYFMSLQRRTADVGRGEENFIKKVLLGRRLLRPELCRPERKDSCI